jgi:hypothetical protein
VAGAGVASATGSGVTVGRSASWPGWLGDGVIAAGVPHPARMISIKQIIKRRIINLLLCLAA